MIIILSCKLTFTIVSTCHRVGARLEKGILGCNYLNIESKLLELIPKSIAFLQYLILIKGV